MIVKVKIYYYSVFDKGSLSVQFEKDDVTVHEVLSRLDRDFGDAFESHSGRRLLDSFDTYFNVFLNDEYGSAGRIREKGVPSGSLCHPTSGERRLG